jgi:hypothetical protein
MKKSTNIPRMRHSIVQRDPLWTLVNRCWKSGDRIVEIGAFAGESTLIFLSAGLVVHSIDPWTIEALERLYDGNVDSQIQILDLNVSLVEKQFDKRTSGWKKLTKYRGYDREFDSEFETASLNGVYIDSVHTYDEVCSTIERWRSKIMPGGWLAGHDYSSQFPGVMTAVNEKVGAPKQLFEDCSWAVEIS